MKQTDKATKTILVADDDLAILDAMTLLLETVGYTVQIAQDAVSVYKKIKMREPSLLLLDVWMSGESGKNICMKLKSQEKTKQIPIIIISANNDTAKIAAEAGADDFIAKPFEMDELLAKIAKYI